MIPFVTQLPLEIQGPHTNLLKELLSIGAIDSALLSLSFYSCMLLVTNATEGVDTDNISLHPQRLHVLPERHYGNTLVNPLGPPEGSVVYIPRYEGHILSHTNPTSRQMIH